MRSSWLTIALLMVIAAPVRGQMTVDQFRASVELEPLAEIAVHRDGRINSMRSHARATVRLVSGPRQYLGQPHLFTYLDMMFRPGAYEDAPIIHVKNKVLRYEIRAAAEASFQQRFPDAPSRLQAEFDQQMNILVDEGLTSRSRLNDPIVQSMLAEKRRDLIRSAKFVQMLETAITVSDRQFLTRTLRIVPPPVGDRNDAWLTIEQFANAPIPDGAGPGFAARRAEVVRQWGILQGAWATGQSADVNGAIIELAKLLPGVNSGLYPPPRRGGWPWSFTTEAEAGGYGWAGWITVAALVALLLAVASVSSAWRPAAIGAALIIGGLQAGALALGQQSTLALESWYIASYNMTWIWMVYLLSVVFLLLGVVYRWRPATRMGFGVFLLAFGLHSFATLLRWYVADRWPNSNMFEAVTTAAWFGGCFAALLEVGLRRSAMRGLFALASAVASMVALMATFFLPLALSADISNRMPVLHDVWLYIHTNVIIFSYCLIFMAAVSALAYLLYRTFGGGRDFARVGGAGSLIMQTPDGNTYLEKAGTSIGQVLDGTTMVLMELSFILLWAGLVMGAIWADHSWGRPWGWDPKEVFALNTFIVFAVLVHVRIKTADKGLWTALIALAGAGVMLFNWVFVNFFIVGLHSYA